MARRIILNHPFISGKNLPATEALPVRQVTQGRDQSLVLLRVWGQFERIPEDEGSCLALGALRASALIAEPFRLELPRTRADI